MVRKPAGRDRYAEESALTFASESKIVNHSQYKKTLGTHPKDEDQELFKFLLKMACRG